MVGTPRKSVQPLDSAKVGWLLSLTEEERRAECYLKMMEDLAENSDTAKTIFDCDVKATARIALARLYEQALQPLWEAESITRELFENTRCTMIQHYEKQENRCKFTSRACTIQTELHYQPILVPLGDQSEAPEMLLAAVLITRGVEDGQIPGNYLENEMLGETDKKHMNPELIENMPVLGKICGTIKPCKRVRGVEPRC